MRSPIIPLETRRKAIELVSGGMRQRQAARQLGAGVGAVAHFGSRRIARAAWPRCRPGTGTLRRTAGRRRGRGVTPPGDDSDVEALHRRVGELELGSAPVGRCSR